MLRTKGSFPFATNYENAIQRIAIHENLKQISIPIYSCHLDKIKGYKLTNDSKNALERSQMLSLLQENYGDISINTFLKI